MKDIRGFCVLCFCVLLMLVLFCPRVQGQDSVTAEGRKSPMTTLKVGVNGALIVVADPIDENVETGSWAGMPGVGSVGGSFELQMNQRRFMTTFEVAGRYEWNRFEAGALEKRYWGMSVLPGFAIPWGRNIFHIKVGAVFSMMTSYKLIRPEAGDYNEPWRNKRTEEQLGETSWEMCIGIGYERIVHRMVSVRVGMYWEHKFVNVFEYERQSPFKYSDALSLRCDVFLNCTAAAKKK